MIRKATLADRPRIYDVRHAVRENRLSQASVAKVDTTADWIFENAAFGVWEEDGAVQGFSVADLYRENGWEDVGRQDNGEIIFRKAI
ncbi:MAG: hypothetical protein HYZ40_15770 [Rhodospirillales bacterium]|nr:hypothetical protein [Rhodospirillales bacterium]